MEALVNLINMVREREAMATPTTYDITSWNDCSEKLYIIYSGLRDERYDDDEVSKMYMRGFNTFIDDNIMLQRFASEYGFFTWYMDPYLNFIHPPHDGDALHLQEYTIKCHRIRGYFISEIAKMYLCMNIYKSSNELIQDLINDLIQEYGTLHQYGSLLIHQQYREDAFI